MHLVARRKADAYGKQIEFSDHAAWSLGLTQKFFSVNCRLVKVITSGKANNLGALQSCLNQNFFDEVQRLEGTNEMTSHLMACCLQAVTVEILMKGVGINLVQPKHQSHSGVMLG